MQCRYCGIENLAAFRICVSCSEPLPAFGQQRRVKKIRARRALSAPPIERHGVHAAVRPTRVRVTGQGRKTVARTAGFRPGSRMKPGIRSRAGKISRTRRLMSVISQPPISNRDSSTTAGSPADMPARDAVTPVYESPQSPRPPSAGPAPGDLGNERSAAHGAQVHARRPFPPLHAAASPADLGAQRFVKPDYERLRTLAALYDKPHPAARRPLRRMILTLATFVVGASAGLVATWWIASADGARPAATIVPPAPTAGLSSLKRNAQAPASVPKGISANELPYDGRGAPAVRTPAPSAPKTNPEELPYGGASSGTNGVEPEEGETRSSAGAQQRKKALRLRGARMNPDGIAARRDDAVNDVQAPPSQRKAEKASQRHRSGQRSAKDREFERIRQQVDEELKKKPEQRRSAGAARTRSRASTGRVKGGETARQDAGNSGRMRNSLGRCERAANLIRREQCKWRLCRGMWGKNGCPSYAHAKPY